MNQIGTKKVLKRGRSGPGLTILIIWDEELCSTFCDALQAYFNATQKHDKIRVRLELLTCQHVEQILQTADEISADYMVILLDPKVRTCVKEIESNLQLVDRNFVCGHMCIVNAFCDLPAKKMAVPYNEINAFRFKYHCPILNVDITKPASCQHLAQRIFTLISMSLGLNMVAPSIGWWMKD